MATLIHPDDTGTLDRAAVEEAARDAGTSAGSTVSVEALDAQAQELRAWLDAHGTVGAAPELRIPAGVPAILVHQHVWPATPEAFRPTTSHGDELAALVDRALAGDEAHDDLRATAPNTLDAAGTVDDDALDREQARRRGLGWAAVVAAWAVAAAVMLPLAINGIVGAFDLTIDLSGNDTVVADEAPVDAPADEDPATLADD